jgi:hypothetical protein
MASRRTAAAAPSLVALVIGLLAFTGCQERPVVDQLPAANFNGPIVVQPPPPAYDPPKPPPTKVAAVPPKKVTPPAPQAFNVPRDWTPLPGATNADGWRYIVIHHSATPSGGAKAFDRMHREKGWDELGYHFVIGNGTDTADGQIEVGSRWPKQKWGAHAKTPDNRYNMQGIGICLVGNFDNERPTQAQLQSVSRLVGYLMKTYHVAPGNVLGHGNTKATDCPGKNVHVADIRRMAMQVAGIDAPASPALARSGNDELLVDK